ncbi:MAG: BlaI/MecI/CopY family transcriptional regulator [Candidatus Avispirillum sp.]
MSECSLGVIEAKFADIIWENEPISSSELVKLCQKEFNWKKSTTYTVLKRLCEKGLFRNTNGTVTSAVSRQSYYSHQSEKFVDEVFNGSLPAFLAAFTSKKSFTPQEIADIRRIIDEYGVK